MGHLNEEKGMRARLAAWLIAVLSVSLGAQQVPRPANARAPDRSRAARPGDPLSRALPEDVGMSSGRLAVIGKVLNADIAANRLPGAVLAIARKGKLVYFEAFGYRDKAAGVRMTTDTIFNIASMTKPLTAVAALHLYEQGLLSIDDPLAKYLPQFSDMRVAVLNPNGDAILDKVCSSGRPTRQPSHTSRRRKRSANTVLRAA